MRQYPTVMPLFRPIVIKQDLFFKTPLNIIFQLRHFQPGTYTSERPNPFALQFNFDQANTNIYTLK